MRPRRRAGEVGTVRKRIAPHLQEAMRIAYLSPETKREVRALLAVAKAALQAAEATQGTDDQQYKLLRLDAALDRLERVSAKGES